MSPNDFIPALPQLQPITSISHNENNNTIYNTNNQNINPYYMNKQYQIDPADLPNCLK